jgi:hypothetical protein
VLRVAREETGDDANATAQINAAAEAKMAKAKPKTAAAEQQAAQ